MTLTLEKIEAIAPDQGSLAAARKLLKPGSWGSLATDGQGLAWGECQGSGATPYRVAVTEADAGYKCSCPSRKFPCKHALAMMWMRVEAPAAFGPGAPPPWVEDWRGRRRGPSGGAAGKAAGGGSIAALAGEPAEEAAPDPKVVAQALAARERNRAQREGLIAEGLDALDRWLTDQLERGLAGFEQRAAGECATLARRLVDAKAGGLANRVERLPPALFAAEEAQRSRVLARELSALHLLACAYRRQDRLPDALRADVRQAVGWTVAREALLEDAATLRVAGRWAVLGVAEEVQPDRLRRVETWLGRCEPTGEGPRHAVLIDFFPVAAGASGGGFAPGEALDATLAFHASPAPLRALVAELRGTERLPEDWSPATGGLGEGLDAYDAALALRPWLGDWPLAAREVTIREGQGRLHAVGEGAAVPLARADEDAAAPLVEAGPIDLFGVWDGLAFRPAFASTPLGRWIAA